MKQFYGQHREDSYVWDVSRQQGLFNDIPRLVVEIGACDGTYLSNSRAFVESGWSALLVEPCPKWHFALAEYCLKHPNVSSIFAAVTDKDGDAKFVVNDAIPDHSFLAGTDSFHSAEGLETVDVKTCTWETLMAGREAPGVLSVDTEGNDNAILRQVVQHKQPWWVIAESYGYSARKEQLELMLPHYHLLNILDVSTIWIRRDIGARWIRP